MPETIEIPHSLARLLSAEDDDFKDLAVAEDVRGVARASLRLLMTADLHANGHQQHAPQAQAERTEPAKPPRRFMSQAAKKAISRRMKAYWKEKRAAAKKGRG